MYKTNVINELKAILEAVSLFINGASTENILKSISIPISRRTLQRRLAYLISLNRIKSLGKGPSRRYLIVFQGNKPMEDFESKNYVTLSSSTAFPPTYQVREPKADYIPLSATAKMIQREINRPIQLRQHVSYNREFLDHYRPNVTQYLPNEVRDRLFELGKPPNIDRPAGTYARKIFNRLLIDLSWNSSRLEGNTYSLLETERLLQLGEIAEGKDFKEAQMILNHKAAIEFLVDSAEHLEINRYMILNLHALLSNNLLSDPRSCGRLRNIPVGILSSVYHPLEVPQLIEECFNQILDTAKAIKHPIEQSFFLMVHLPYLQPFEDVNKRVSRLAANIPLIEKNLCPLSFVGVSETLYIAGLLAVYELNRIELFRDVFIWAYERSCSLYSATRKSLGEPDPFRMKYRDLIGKTVLNIVSHCMDKKSATTSIRKTAEEMVAPIDRKHFIEVVEVEIMSLHEGNIARYHIKPSAYEHWHGGW